MEGLRGAIEVGQLDQFVTEFYAKRGMTPPNI